jgi:acetyl-CoA C-acetyltransferase
MGNVVSANLGQAPARQAALGAGLSPGTICTTVNKVCASGMKAVMLGAQAIQLGDADVVVAGGMESMSQIPFYVPNARFGYGYGHGQLIDGLAKDGLTDAYDGQAMGCSGDATAAHYGLTRAMQDEFAINSYHRAAEATASGAFGAEIVPVSVPQRKGSAVLVSEDEEYKKVQFEKIPQLKPAFGKEGTVTAANASTINDGAAALLLLRADKAEALGIRPLARVVAYADAEQEPQWFTTSPLLAARKALQKAGLRVEDIELFEVNEAFAAVALVFAQELSIDRSILNVHGGAVALGHPLGASGARILVTLVHALHRHQKRFGLAAICNGGGGASAVIVERL